MNLLGYILANIVETLLRFLPFPAKTGLIEIGNPDKNSPVFLTCNFHLTVERVKKILKGTDAYLLVANSKGRNVWCAATGGHFTSHDVISVLKTSGIEKIVEHREIILPQLAASGIEARAILQKTGWKVVWGPVDAKDIPAFIKNNFKKIPEMQEVKFPWTQRIEMATAWAFPVSVISTLLMLFLWRSAIPTLILLIWGLSFLIFLLFPLYDRWFVSERSKRRFQLLLWGLLSIGIVLYNFLIEPLHLQHILRWEVISLIIVLVLTFDLKGSTPVYKSGKQESKLKITVDENKCKGVGLCVEVCPRRCHEVSKERQITTIPQANRCVKCGACIVQCPFDALYFRDSTGKVFSAETIRKFKLSLKGNRTVKTEGD
jgi:NAD-dependent dihydropyrimidine dehydrogenase PreA subunit